MENKFLAALRQLLAGKQQTIPSWLEDLLVFGPRLEQWKPIEQRANRVLITEFLANWMKSAEITQEQCLQWLDPYCCEVLAVYSKSGRSAIRHGTKANVRWVYNSGFGFDFEAIAREAPGQTPDQPAYMALLTHWNDLLWEAKRIKRESYVPPVFEPVLPVKKRYEEQFNKGVQFALQKQAEALNVREITEKLNEQGFLSKTGRKWKESMLRTAFHDLAWPRGAPKASQEPADAPPP